MPTTTPTEDVSSKLLTLKTSTVGIVLLALINLVIIGPGGWLIASSIDRYKADQEIINKQIESLNIRIDQTSKAFYYDTVKLTTYNADKEQFNHRLQNLNTTVQNLVTSLIDDKDDN